MHYAIFAYIIFVLYMFYSTIICITVNSSFDYSSLCPWDHCTVMTYWAKRVMGPSKDAPQPQQAYIQYAEIVMLARNGARRAGVPAATNAKVYQSYLNRAVHAESPDVLASLAAECAEELCQLATDYSKQNYSPMVST